jgi:putative MATE family efflux protein
MQRARKDLTVGTPWKVLLLFSLPTLLGNILQQAYSWVDGALVGWVLGETAFAAVGAVGSATYIGLTMASAFPNGMSGYTAELAGAGDDKAVRHSYGVSILLNLFAGLVVTLAMLLLVDPLLALLSISPDSGTYAFAKIYMYIIFGVGILPTFFYYLYLNFLRAIGDSRTPLYLLIIYSLLNILFDYFFIVLANWGVMGGALAYALAMALSVGIGCLWVHFKYPWLRLGKEDFVLTRSFVKEHLRFGLPVSLQFGILGIGVIVMQGAVDLYGGEAGMQGYSAASKLENLLCCLINALGASFIAFAGQNYGAHKYARIKKAMAQSGIMIVIYALVCILVSFSFRDVVTQIFISNPSAEAQEYAREYLNWDMVGYIPLFAIFLFRYFLLGIGKALTPFLGGVGELVGRLSMSLGFARLYGEPAALGASCGAWYICAFILGIGAFFAVYRNPRFKKDEEIAANPPSMPEKPL